MKKILTIILASLMILTLAACTAKPGENGENVDPGKMSEKAQEDYEDSLEMFSPEAAEYYLEKATGIKLSQIEPDWEWEFANSYDTLGQNGRGLFKFTKKDGEVTDDEINAYFGKVFDSTAAISDDGYNIIGYEFVGEGENALDEVTLEDALDSWLPGWCFKKDGTIYTVYVSSEYDKEKESTLDRLFYYNAVKIDIAQGMQKGWDDYMSDIEENADEIEEALKDFAN